MFGVCETWIGWRNEPLKETHDVTVDVLVLSPLIKAYGGTAQNLHQLVPYNAIEKVLISSSKAIIIHKSIMTTTKNICQRKSKE